MFDHLDFMGWGGAMGLLWIVLIVVVVWALVAGLRPRGGGEDRGGPSAREILDRRYASGEIDADEYQRRLNDLRKP